ncbi:MAG TPA: sugar phosphate isomerase/epimerase [Candidatus Dormibacteraeota bacterium]|nr:sugar phosphate isomerase/epimerase [Candidatus Dormibacteraeota bacterium]
MQRLPALTARALSLARPGANGRRTGGGIAVSPVSWGISEAAAWGPQLEPNRVLSEMASLGAGGIEAGPSGFLPDRSDAARTLLRRHGLRMVAGPVFGVLHHHDLRQSELAHIDGHAGWLSALGAMTLVLTVIGSRTDEPRASELSSTGWAHLLSAIGSVQHVCAVHGLRLAVEPRRGSMIEGPAEIERLLVGSEAGVSIDIGQLVIAGADPIEIVELAARRIQHVHLNDLDGGLARSVRGGGLDYSAAVSRGLFKPLGSGDADVARVVEELRSGGYKGWYGLQSDIRLNSVADDPLAGVRESLAYARALLAA